MSKGTSDFAGRILKLAAAVGSQRKLAARIGVSPAAVTGWLGTTNPYTTTINDICAKTGVSREWLLSGDGNDDEQIATFKERLVEDSAVKEHGPRAALRRARLDAGMSYRDLARKTGREVSYFQRLEEGLAPITENTARLIQAALPSLASEDLLGGSDAPVILHESGIEATYGAMCRMILPPGMKGRYVPLLSMAEAGPVDAGHTDQYYDYTGVFAMNVDDRAAFAIKVSGDSMEDRLKDGDYVICSPGAPLENGVAAVVRTRSEQVYIKYWRKDGERVILESQNPVYEPIVLPPREVVGAWAIVQHIHQGKITRETP